MFLYRLTQEEKKGLVILAYRMVGIDGAYEANEASYVCLLTAEAGDIEAESLNSDSISNDDILSLFKSSSRSSRIILCLELLIVAFSDGQFHAKEKQLFESIRMDLGLEPSEIEPLVVKAETAARAFSDCRSSFQ